MRPLVQLCTWSKDGTVLGNAAGALANLARHAPSAPQIVHEGAVAPLANLCASSTDTTVLVCSALAVCRLVASGVKLAAREKAAAREALQHVQQALAAQQRMPKYLVEPLAQAIRDCST